MAESDVPKAVEARHGDRGGAADGQGPFAVAGGASGDEGVGDEDRPRRTAKCEVGASSVGGHTKQAIVRARVGHPEAMASHLGLEVRNRIHDDRRATIARLVDHDWTAGGSGVAPDGHASCTQHGLGEAHPCR